MKQTRLGVLPQNINVDFFKYTRIFFIFSALLIVLSIVSPLIKGYNLGIDFKGGIVIDFLNEEHTPLEDVREKLNVAGIQGYSIKEFGSNGFQVEVSQSSVAGKNANDTIDLIKSNLAEYKLQQTQFVGPSISDELLKGGIWATVFSFLGIFFYLWVRYDWQFGLIGVLTLIHDVFISLFFLSLFSYEVNISSIAAVLTVIGYSINDTVVLFDQVRENVRKYIKDDVKSIINKSINQVFSRSIATSVTVLLVLLSVFFLGGEALKSFSFTLLVGVFFGAYSSICLAVPLLYYVGNIKARELAKNK